MQIEYTHKISAHSRGTRISVGVEGNVVVTTPRAASMAAVEKFVAKYASWIERHVARARLRTVMRIPRKDVAGLKKKALAIAEERCKFFAKVYGLEYKKISIRSQKSRWGSCSAAGNLSFNYKIVALPSETADYIIVHEICHLAEMNHSKKFWDLVAQTVPNHQELRKQLRKMHILVE